jgi:predicted metal-binding protein
MKIGIIICDRYRSCGGGKCIRAMNERSGAFSRYTISDPLELVGYSTCGGCPGGNVEYVPEEMLRNGAEAIHLATGLVVGYPPCPYIDYFVAFIKEQYNIPVIVGTHPIPQKYYVVHRNLESWDDMKHLKELLATQQIREAYD